MPWISDTMNPILASERVSPFTSLTTFRASDSIYYGTSPASWATEIPWRKAIASTNTASHSTLTDSLITAIALPSSSLTTHPVPNRISVRLKERGLGFLQLFDLYRTTLFQHSISTRKCYLLFNGLSRKPSNWNLFIFMIPKITMEPKQPWMLCKVLGLYRKKIVIL